MDIAHPPPPQVWHDKYALRDSVPKDGYSNDVIYSDRYVMTDFPCEIPEQIGQDLSR